VNESLQEKRIRLLLLDDQALFRASLARYLSPLPGLEVVCECGSSAEALGVLAASAIDVVVMDFDRGTKVEDGFIPAARRAGYQGRFLVVAAEADAKGSAIAIKLGVSGIFLKSKAPDRLVQAIRLVADGAVWLEQSIIQNLADRLIDRCPEPDGRRNSNGLTSREHKVLLGVLGGLTNRKIGDRIGVSEGSVKASLQQLFSRTGVRTRSQLVRIALEGSLGSLKKV
jgi:DNA-binding NarL/FixJ family response regulator